MLRCKRSLFSLNNVPPSGSGPAGRTPSQPQHPALSWGPYLGLCHTTGAWVTNPRVRFQAWKWRHIIMWMHHEKITPGARGISPEFTLSLHDIAVKMLGLSPRFTRFSGAKSDSVSDHTRSLHSTGNVLNKDPILSKCQVLTVSSSPFSRFPKVLNHFPLTKGRPSVAEFARLTEARAAGRLSTGRARRRTSFPPFVDVDVLRKCTAQLGTQYTAVRHSSQPATRSNVKHEEREVNNDEQPRIQDVSANNHFFQLFRKEYIT